MTVLIYYYDRNSDFDKKINNVICEDVHSIEDTAETYVFHFQRLSMHPKQFKKQDIHKLEITED